MSEKADTVKEVRRTIERLIELGSSYTVDELDGIYHPSLKVVIIDDDGHVCVFDKARNMEVFRSRRADGAEPLSRWARFDHIEATGRTAFVVVTRRMELRGRLEKFVLAIDLVQEDACWQVTHETVFVQPVRRDADVESHRTQPD